MFIIACFLCTGIFANSFGCFVRGDANGDGAIDIADSVTINAWVTGNPGTFNDNLDALDANDDGTINIADSIYVNGILFSQYPIYVPNFETGAGTDPTPDNVNNEGGGEDEGDYLHGDSVSHYAPSASTQVMAISPELPDWWPDHETTHIMVAEPPPTYDVFNWRLMTNPAGSYGLLGNVCVFHSGAAGQGPDSIWDITGVIGTARKIRSACKEDAKNSGPGVSIAYNFDWMLSAGRPSMEGLTKLLIDGKSVKFTFTFGAYSGSGPMDDTHDFDVEKNFNLGKYGLIVYSYYGEMTVASSMWGIDWDNDPNDVTGDPNLGRACEGSTAGFLIVTTLDIANAMPETVPTNHFIYLRAVGAFDLEEGLDVWHAPLAGDASDDDEAQCLLRLMEPERVTTSWEN
jgi:hypothetical protein